MEMFLSHTRWHPGYHEGIYRAKRYSVISVFKLGNGKLAPPPPNGLPKEIDLHSLETVLDSGKKPLELGKIRRKREKLARAFFGPRLSNKFF
jgi:hypothetical protein